MEPNITIELTPIVTIDGVVIPNAQISFKQSNPIPEPTPDPIHEPFLGTVRFFDDFEKGKAIWENGGEFNSSYYGFGSSVITPGVFQAGKNSLQMSTTGRNADFYAQSNNFRYGVAKAGDDIIISFKVFIPKTIGFYFPAGDWGFFLLNQFKGVSSDNKINNPLHSLYISSRNGNKSQFLSVGSNARQWGDTVNPSFNQVAGAGKELELPINKEIEIKIRTKFGDGDGIYQVWQDGVLIFNLTNQRTFRANSGIDRIDNSISNYGRYHRQYVNGVWDRINGTRIFVDEYGIYNTNPKYDYTKISV